MLQLASYADALWARHAIFLPHEEEEEYCVTSPKSVCVGGYAPARLLKIAESEMPLHISLNMQNDVQR